mmetsp:Transcript_15541/g.17261  ORF Transcript_15541/g.17261 Transcript_15541/m.17261 type:complete len:562 (+) Transcript_15541:46-1731(+)
MDIGDIEDLGVGAGLEEPRKKVTNTVRKSLKNYKIRKQGDTQDKPSESIPGTQKIMVRTFGCSHNVSDSEFMMGQLSEYGYRFTSTEDEADLYFVNSCTVKNPSQEGMISLIKRAKDMKKPVVISGCVPQGDRNLKGLDGCSIVGITQIDRVVEVVEESLKGNVVRLLAKKELPTLDLPKVRKNALIEIIPISTGCLGSCTYCKTKHARGKLGSYDPQAIIDRAIQACEEDVKQIWITSEDTGAYGRDIGTNLPALLRGIIKELPDDVMLRIGMTNPPFILEHKKAIAEILRHPQVFEFLHIPVQSGNDPVLERMNREYTIEEFNELCDYMNKHVPGITLATDIICGFPTETEKEFEDSMELVRKYQFRVINISQFYSRPGTVAAKMPKVNSKDVKKRSQRITQLFESYRTTNFLADTRQRIWVSEMDDKNADMMVGHTKNYTKILIPRDEALMGKSVIVDIIETHMWHAVGKIIDSNPKPLIQEVGAANFQVKTGDDFKMPKNDKKITPVVEDAADQTEATQTPTKGGISSGLIAAGLGLLVAALGLYLVPFLMTNTPDL